MGIDIRDPDQPVGTLSGGERQSVAIARAIYFGARVLILDEPTSALGVKQAGVVLRYILMARERGVAVIFITHNPHHAYPVGDRFVILNRGRTLGSYDRGEIDQTELVRLMAGGAELAELEHELATIKAEIGAPGELRRCSALPRQPAVLVGRGAPGSRRPRTQRPGPRSLVPAPRRARALLRRPRADPRRAHLGARRQAGRRRAALHPAGARARRRGDLHHAQPAPRLPGRRPLRVPQPRADAGLVRQGRDRPARARAADGRRQRAGRARAGAGRDQGRGRRAAEAPSSAATRSIAAPTVWA